MRLMRPIVASPVCPRCGGLRRRLGRAAGFIGLHRSCCCVSGNCARLCRGDEFIPPHDERCSPFEGRVNSFEITFEGVDAAKCGCTEDPFYTGLWNEIVDLQLDGTYNVPQNPNFPCDYLLTGVGSYHVRQWDGSTCGQGSVLAEFQGPLSIRVSNGSLDVADANFNTVFAFTNFKNQFSLEFDADLCCGEETLWNELECGGSTAIPASDGGTATYRPGAPGFKTTVPNPFPLNTAEWTDLKIGTNCPIKGLYQTYDFNLILDGKLSTGALVKVEVDAEVVASATEGVWTAGTASIVGGSTNLTILDQQMEWTSNGWKFTFEFRDETDSSVHTLELLRNTQSPHLCSWCWGSIDEFTNGWRMTNVQILEEC